MTVMGDAALNGAAVEAPQPGAKPATPPAAQPSSTLEAAVPGTFVAGLWASVAGSGGIFSAILSHPFLTELVDGSLDEAAFKFYVVQGALYLREYARALAQVASKALRPQWVALLCRCAHDAYQEESSCHKEFLAYWDTTVEAETAGACLTPHSLLYTSFVLATVHERSFYEGLAAILPCFVVYLEVGKALQQQGSRHPLFQKFIDRFGGEEYEHLTLEVVRMANEVAAELGEAQRQRMAAIFQQGCRLEWMFWEASYRRQEWPV